MLKGKQGEREDMGVDLYSVQQELARNQMSVEQLHDDYAKRQKHRLQAEQELTEMRDTYTGKQKLIKMERKKGGSVYHNKLPKNVILFNRYESRHVK